MTPASTLDLPVDPFDPPAIEDWKDVVVELLPPQGNWDDESYLWLTDHARKLVELNDGRLEVLPMPTDLHQSIVKALAFALHLFIDPRGGTVQFSPLRLRIRSGKFREPDVLLVIDANDSRRQNRFWTGADFVAEVVSPDHPERDREEKPIDYAAAGISEYWIVDPQKQTISVLALRGKQYQLVGEYGRGVVAISERLAGFSIAVDAVLDAKRALT